MYRAIHCPTYLLTHLLAHLRRRGAAISVWEIGAGESTEVGHQCRRGGGGESVRSNM